MNVCLCLYMCITCMLGALGAEKRMAGVADACEPPVGAWQQVLSTAEPSLQP